MIAGRKQGRLGGNFVFVRALQDHGIAVFLIAQKTDFAMRHQEHLADVVVTVKQVFALGQLVALTRVKKIYQLPQHDIYHVRLLHCMARSVH